MALQVRLVHALGDRLIELEPRNLERPVLVGRGGDADVQVPSMNVSRRHCVLFVHEGQWCIQDGNGGRGTFVNGTRLAAPAYLNPGDVVTLGTDPNPPTLIIDPYGIELATAHAGASAAQGEAARPASPGRGAGWGEVPTVPAGSPQDAGTVSSTYAGEEVGAAAAEAYAVPAEVEQPAEAAGADDDWMSAAAAPATDAAPRRPSGRRTVAYATPAPKPGSASGAMIAVGIVLTAAILGGGGWLYYSRQAAARAAATPVNTVIVNRAPVAAERKNNIFDQAEADRKATDRAKAPRPVAEQGGGPAAGARAVAVAAPTEDDATKHARDPAWQDPNWRRVLDARNNSQPETAVVIYDEYLKMAPNSPLADQCHKYIDEALDQIWWTHVSEMMKKRDVLKEELAAKNTELSQSLDADFKRDTLGPEKAAIEEKIKDLDEKLVAMNYTSPDRPNLLDPDQLATLRQSRNAERYGAWKEQAYDRLRTYRGAKSVW